MNDLGSDVVIVGTGLGGSTLAYGLARRGLAVILIERGDFLRPTTDALLPVYKARIGNQAVVAGLSKFYGAAMYRFREIDFQPIETGTGCAPAWPISYQDLEPYYCEAEHLYKVHGSSDDDPSEPPRSRPWPHAPIPHQGPVIDLVSRLTERSGLQVSHIPRALDYNPSDESRCVLCQHCDAYYCPRDAKMDAETAALRPALQMGTVNLLTNTECLQVLTTSDGKKVSGVRVCRAGDEFAIHARFVSVCAGLKESPLLLWRSRNTKHPRGLGNSSGTLGVNMAAHTHGWLFPIAPGVQKLAFHQKSFAINAFYQNAPNWPYPCGTIQAAGHMEAWLSLDARWRSIAKLLLRNTFQTFVMTEALPSKEAGFSLTDSGAQLLSWPRPNKKAFATLRQVASEAFKDAGYLVFRPPQMETDWHPVGTARMGNDSRASVIDSHCQAHDIEGLYVVDASSLPRAGAVNTGLTIVALALRAAETISHRITGR